jgi:hypothetical protein
LEEIYECGVTDTLLIWHKFSSNIEYSYLDIGTRFRNSNNLVRNILTTGNHFLKMGALHGSLMSLFCRTIKLRSNWRLSTQLSIAGVWMFGSVIVPVQLGTPAAARLEIYIREKAR